MHPENVIVAPAGVTSPRLSGGNWTEGPHYPSAARDAGIEDRVITAFVVDDSGAVEYRTISLLNHVVDPSFFQAVCAFLRTAKFNWAPRAPTRGLVITPFEFTLSGVAVRRPLPSGPSLDSLRDVPRHFTPAELASWIESKPHCP
jgi:Gram-negative bacterial TonB protein C-terminal